MAGTRTQIAHCGACATGHMALEQDTTGARRYVCGLCGCTTPWRASAAEAGEDAVWVTLAQSQQARARQTGPWLDFRMATPEG